MQSDKVMPPYDGAAMLEELVTLWGELNEYEREAVAEVIDELK